MHLLILPIYTAKGCCLEDIIKGSSTEQTYKRLEAFIYSKKADILTREHVQN